MSALIASPLRVAARSGRTGKRLRDHEPLLRVRAPAREVEVGDVASLRHKQAEVVRRPMHTLLGVRRAIGPRLAIRGDKLDPEFLWRFLQSVQGKRLSLIHIS